jgi:hypothetical protein
MVARRHPRECRLAARDPDDDESQPGQPGVHCEPKQGDPAGAAGRAIRDRLRRRIPVELRCELRDRRASPCGWRTGALGLGPHSPRAPNTAETGRAAEWTRRPANRRKMQPV